MDKYYLIRQRIFSNVADRMNGSTLNGNLLILFVHGTYAYWLQATGDLFYHLMAQMILAYSLRTAKRIT